MSGVRFSIWETKFANQIFHPFNNGETDRASYDTWLLKFCVSVSWRVITFFIEEDGLAHFPTPLQDRARSTHKVWKEFLLDQRPHPGQYEQHFLPLDVVESFTHFDMPTNINRYILRSVDINAAWGGEDAFIYSKLGRFAIVGFVNMERPKEWQGTKIHVRRGMIKPQTYMFPNSFGDYLLERARKAASVQSRISDQQKQKIEESFRKDIEKLANSETFRAIDQDVRLFGKDVFPAK